MSDLKKALETGDLEQLRALVTEHPEQAKATDEQGITYLMHALYHGRGDIASVLLDASDERSPFEEAALGRADRLAPHLDRDAALANAAAPDGFTMLHLAAFFGHEDAARLLLERGAAPDTVSTNAMALRPIHSAAASASAGVVKALLAAGAEPSSRQAGGYTPLMSAATRGCEETMTALLEAGADPDDTDDAGKTALDHATEREQRDVVEPLLARHRPTA